MIAMHRLSVKQMSEKLRNKEITSIELTRHYLDRIDKYNLDLNAFVSVTPESA